MSGKNVVAAAANVLAVLRVLEGNFAQGFAPTDLARATGLPPSQITRYVATLEAKGYAERIPETGRIRLSHRLARVAVQVLDSLNGAAARINESTERLRGV